MPELPDGANLAIVLVIVLGIGYLIFRIDRRVKQEGGLFKRDASSMAKVNITDSIEGERFGTVTSLSTGLRKCVPGFLVPKLSLGRENRHRYPERIYEMLD